MGEGGKTVGMILSWKERQRWSVLAPTNVYVGLVTLIPLFGVGYGVYRGRITAVWLLVAFVPVYSWLLWLVNRTEIEVDEAGVTVRNGPLPSLLARSRRIEREQVKELLIRKRPYGERSEYFASVALKTGRWCNLVGAYTNPREPELVIERLAGTWKWTGEKRQVVGRAPRGEYPTQGGCLWLVAAVLGLIGFAWWADNWQIGFWR